MITVIIIDFSSVLTYTDKKVGFADSISYVDFFDIPSYRLRRYFLHNKKVECRSGTQEFRGKRNEQAETKNKDILQKSKAHRRRFGRAGLGH